MTPNVPSYVPSEWRRVRIPVSWQSGVNSIVISRVSGGLLAVDDVRISTPDDTALASAHVRGLEGGDLDDLVAFVASLDGNDAPIDGPANALVVTRLKLKLGSGRRPDRAGFVVKAEIDAAWTGSELALALSAGMTLRVTDGDGSFDATVSLDDCTLRGNGRTIRCVNELERRRAKLRQLPSGGWGIQMNAGRLADASTGADDPEANPVEAPVTVETQWNALVHTGQATACVGAPPSRLSCRLL
jgi:hypothetical protein